MRIFVVVLLACLAIGSNAGSLKLAQIEEIERLLDTLKRGEPNCNAQNVGGFHPRDCETDPDIECQCECKETADGAFEFEAIVEGNRCPGGGGRGMPKCESAADLNTYDPADCETTACDNFCVCSEGVDDNGDPKFYWGGDSCRRGKGKGKGKGKPPKCETADHDGIVIPPECGEADASCTDFCTCGLDAEGVYNWGGDSCSDAIKTGKLPTCDAAAVDNTVPEVCTGEECLCTCLLDDASGEYKWSGDNCPKPKRAESAATRKAKLEQFEREFKMMYSKRKPDHGGKKSSEEDKDGDREERECELGDSFPPGCGEDGEPDCSCQCVEIKDEETGETENVWESIGDDGECPEPPCLEVIDVDEASGAIVIAVPAPGGKDEGEPDATRALQKRERPEGSPLEDVIKFLSGKGRGPDIFGIVIRTLLQFVIGQVGVDDGDRFEADLKCLEILSAPTPVAICTECTEEGCDFRVVADGALAENLPLCEEEAPEEPPVVP